jgi:hypothetical protein
MPGRVHALQFSSTNHSSTYQIKMHQLYIEDLLNPFKDIGSAIVSKRFDEKVRKNVAAFNQSDGMI